MRFKSRASRPRLNLADASAGDNVDAGETGRRLDSDREGDWLEAGVTCMMCGKGSGDDAKELLACCEIGCPVALHELCILCEPKFDELGKFYCPYCWYKRAQARTRELREKAMMAKKALSAFIDAKMVSDNVKEKRNGGLDLDKETNSGVVGAEGGRENDGDAAVAKVGKCGLGGRMVEGQMDAAHYVIVSGDNVRDRKVEKTPGIESFTDSVTKENDNVETVFGIPEDEVLKNESEIQGEDVREVRDGKDGGVLGGKEQVGPLNICCGQEDTISVDSSKENQGWLEEKEQMNQDGEQATVLSRRGDLATKVPEVSDSNNKKKATRPQKVDRPKKSPPQPQTTTSQEKDENQNERVRSSKKSIQPGENPGKFTNLKFPNEKRKRLHWTPEEEEMLKEGVQKFSSSVNKNLPWRKILEFGHHVFDLTRTPTDLKDKWRNILAKERAHGS